MNLTNLPPIQLSDQMGLAFALNGARYVLASGFAFLLIWVLLRKPLAGRFLYPTRPKSTDILREMRYSILSVVIFALLTGAGGYGALHGVFHIYLDLNDYGLPYFFMSVALLLFLHDTYFYWTHRWMHHPKLFRSFHGVHHRSVRPTPFAALSFSWKEAVVQGIFPLFLLTVLPLHPLALGAWLNIMMLINVMGHLGYELFPKGWTRRFLFNTATHHSLHHSTVHYNFGLYFPWWDMICKTEHPDYHKIFDQITSPKSP